MNSVARRYAKAFFDASKEFDIEKAKSELKELTAVFDETNLDYYFFSPLLDKTKKHALLNEVFKYNDFMPATRKFMTLLIDKKRIDLFPSIIEHFTDLYNKEKNILKVECTSARELDPKVMDQIIQKLQNTFKMNIIIDSKIDSSLIGGLTLRIGSRLYDFSIKNHLENIQRRRQWH